MSEPGLESDDAASEDCELQCMRKLIRLLSAI